MKQKDIHIKTLFNEGWYYFTISQTYREKVGSTAVIVLCHTCDRGDKAYQHIIEKFPVNTFGLRRLKKFCEANNYTWFGDPDTEGFELQFLAMRTKGKVFVKYEATLAAYRNSIGQWDLPDAPEEYNVLAPKRTDHYYKNKNKKRIPVQ